MADYWVDGHCIWVDSPEQAKDIARHLYNFEPERVRLWTDDDQAEIDEQESHND